jgi:hypothetical protein
MHSETLRIRAVSLFRGGSLRQSFVFDNSVAVYSLNIQTKYDRKSIEFIACRLSKMRSGLYRRAVGETSREPIVRC